MGQINAIMAIAHSFGDIIANSVVVEATIDMDPIYTFGGMTAVMVGFSFISLCMVREPPEGGIKEKNVCKSIKILTILILKEC